MKFLLTGAKGLLGTALRESIIRGGHSCKAMERPSLTQYDRAALIEQLRQHDVLIHAAANTNVEQCEVAPDVCYQDNFLLTEVLASAARDADTKFVFISSTGIYGAGRAAPYNEYDSTNPTTHHHKSKKLAEAAVLSCHPANLVVRTGWLFGGTWDNPKNFVARRIEEARRAMSADGLIASNDEQRGSPSFTGDVADRILHLIRAKLDGVYNCVNTGSASRYEYVREIVSHLNIPVTVQPASASLFNRKAMVSNNEMAANWKMTSLGMEDMATWQASLATYIQHLLRTEAPK